MQDLKAAYTEVWVPAPVVPLVQFADRVRAISATGIDTLGIPGRDVRPGMFDGFDSIISWYGTQRPEFRASMPSCTEYRPALPPADCPSHAVEFFGSTSYPTLQVDPIPQEPFIAIHPFSGSTKKNWPLENFQQLALPYPARYCISPEQTLPGAVQYDNLYDLARWLRGAVLYIGNDSGITHLAAACGVPTVAIFTEHSNPRIWAPRGPHVEVVPPGHSVSAAVHSLLARCGIAHPESIRPHHRT
ncbi:hypothetical protein F183_A35550 [Bryobacterales bacterium F-183]|nr:hypothetical protein F183_A35550 [Bryobacterales bacterium F-183]